MLASHIIHLIEQSHPHNDWIQHEDERISVYRYDVNLRLAQRHPTGTPIPPEDFEWRGMPMREGAQTVIVDIYYNATLVRPIYLMQFADGQMIPEPKRNNGTLTLDPLEHVLAQMYAGDYEGQLDALGIARLA